MQIEIVIEPAKLKGKDSGFSLGYLSVEDHESEFAFFKKRKCMILVDLYLLLEALERFKAVANKEDKWVGTSNGAVIKLVKLENNLVFVHRGIHHMVNFDEFFSALRAGIKSFLASWQLINGHCTEQSAYIDLKTYLDA
ncbi:MAG: hypothetical protein FD123_2566 [Bacteroidetes bacterium]|nr:MAG: hypothetical protein FD123_2566 [Bacteroidota bacterium]